MSMRHESKHPLNEGDYHLLRSRLGALLPLDRHVGAQGFYRVRSLYFDDPFDSALRAKREGLSSRDKFRIRCYDGDFSYIRLEKKCKRQGLGCKYSAPITRAEMEALLAGDLEILRRGDDPLRLELYGRMRGTLLRPRVIVDYKRIPYLFPAGNVRITLDSDIRTGLASLDFFSPDATRLSASDCYGLLEVKYDAFLPDWIAGLVRMGDRPAAAFSKYALARRYD